MKTMYYVAVLNKVTGQLVWILVFFQSVFCLCVCRMLTPLLFVLPFLYQCLIETSVSSSLYRKKEYMSRRMTEMDRMLNERHLFHGTSQDVVEGICKHNFDPRVCGKHATMFGQGSYFARKAVYSHNFSKRSPRGVHYMFLAKVLTGKFTVGNPSMRRPPPLNPRDASSDLFDSCVDNWMDPQIFVIFNDDQSYPYFIIQYEEVSNTVAIWRALHIWIPAHDAWDLCARSASSKRDRSGCAPALWLELMDHMGCIWIWFPPSILCEGSFQCPSSHTPVNTNGDCVYVCVASLLCAGQFSEWIVCANECLCYGFLGWPWIGTRFSRRPVDCLTLGLEAVEASHSYYFPQKTHRSHCCHSRSILAICSKL